MADANSLINLGDLSKPVNTFIEKIAGAIGVLYEPTRIIRKAKADAKADEIQELNKLHIDELKKRAIIRIINEESIKQDNIEKIIEKTIPQIKTDAEPEALNNDWITNFFEKSRLVSNDDMQLLWSKILAGETNHPGSFSRLTLKRISELEKQDADMFTSLASCTFMIDEQTVVLFWDEGKNIYGKSGINFDSLMQLETLGLIQSDFLGGYYKANFPQKIKISYFGCPIILEFKGKTNDLSIGKVCLTQAGQQLISICGAVPNGELKDIAVNKWKKMGLQFMKACNQFSVLPLLREVKEIMLVINFIGSLEGTTRVRARRFVAAFLLRITRGLRSGADEPRLRGSQNVVGAAPLCAILFTRILPARDACVFLNGAGKTSSNLSVMRHCL